MPELWVCEISICYTASQRIWWSALWWIKMLSQHRTPQSSDPQFAVYCRFMLIRLLRLSSSRMSTLRLAQLVEAGPSRDSLDEGFASTCTNSKHPSGSKNDAVVLITSRFVYTVVFRSCLVTVSVPASQFMSSTQIVGLSCCMLFCHYRGDLSHHRYSSSCACDV